MTAPIAYVDVTELFNTPLRTGIQRVERELIRYWPGPAEMVLCIYDCDADEMRLLPDKAALILTSQTTTHRFTMEEERAALRDLLSGEPLRRMPPDGNPLINPELFFHSGRARFYERIARQGQRDICWLIYDFLPYLRPEWFEQGSARSAMPYLRAMRSIPRVAFISKHTREDYLRRVMRATERDGPVIALGGDGLGLERQAFSPRRDTYVVVGSIEPRKRVAAVLEAFVALWAAGSRARLTVVGRLLTHARREIELLAELRSNPLFLYLADASDLAIRDALGRARATIFASEGEGFGLPPFESLYCGIPVIVSASVPSIELLPEGGQVRLWDVSPQRIADAVRSLEDDAVAETLWNDAARLHVPSWRDFAAALARWATSPDPPAACPSPDGRQATCSSSSTARRTENPPIPVLAQRN